MKVGDKLICKKNWRYPLNEYNYTKGKTYIIIEIMEEATKVSGDINEHYLPNKFLEKHFYTNIEIREMKLKTII